MNVLDIVEKQQLRTDLATFKPGDTINIKLIRGGARQEVSVTLGTR